MKAYACSLLRAIGALTVLYAVVLLCTFSVTAQAQGGGKQVLSVLQNNLGVLLLSPEHYEEGNTEDFYGCLSVKSSKDWDLSVRAQTNFAQNQYTIPLENIGIKVTTPVGIEQPIRYLSVDDQVIVDDADRTILPKLGLFSQSLDLQITIVGGENVMNTPAGEYSTTIIFTLSPD